MRIQTLTDRQLMQHWDVAARVCAGTRDDAVMDHYIERLKYIDGEMNRRDKERAKNQAKAARIPIMGNSP